MKLLLGSIIKVSVRYVYLRKGVYQYQRKIPLDLLDRYDGIKSIKLNLSTTSLSEATHRVRSLNSKYEATWAAMRTDPMITPQSVRETAKKLLVQYNLAPSPAINTAQDEALFIDLVIDPKREKAAEGDEEAYRNLSPSEYLTPPEAEALRMLRVPQKLLLSESLEIYLKGHQKRDNTTFDTYTRRAWKKLTDTLGDKPFEDVSRADVNTLIDTLLENGARTTTVSRQLNSMRAVFNSVIAEKELTKTNPFIKARIPGLGGDAKKRQPFNGEELKTLAKACIEQDDDMRWLVALQMDLGCRLGEIAGLALADLHTEDAIPYVVIQPHKWRSLKTKNSIRDVPLVGLSLWAAKRIRAAATKGQLYAFPRYTDGITCKATNASNALNDWIRAQSIDNTTHSFRHSMRDRLRNINAPKDIQDAIGGWGKQTIAENYGQGFSLQTLKNWLDKVVFI